MRPWRVLCVLALVLLSGCTARAPETNPLAFTGPRTYEFVSRPDLNPPRVSIRTARAGLDPGYVFLMVRSDDREPGDAQGYAVVVNRAGELIWTKRFDHDKIFPNDLSVQRYLGEPVITYWQGSRRERGWAEGEYVLLDSRYREIATVDGGNGLRADFHDMEITPRGTAYVLSYPRVRGNRKVREGVIQEVDIATGRVLFEWHSIDHIGLEESAAPAPDKGDAFDYFHVNSVDEGPDGDLLVSARHTKAIYRIDRKTGEVEWTMGGSHNDFNLGPGVEFGWQHDARWHSDGRISLLDNASNLDDKGPPSRALTLSVDEEERTAEVISEYVSPDGLTSGSQANHQLLPSGNSMVGWGSRPAFTAFAPSGDILLHGDLPKDAFSYRARLAEWTGRPVEPPAAVVQDSRVYVSWNGATEVREWRLLTGATETVLVESAVVPRSGFETAIDLPDGAAYVAVEALDAEGEVLGHSQVTSAES